MMNPGHAEHIPLRRSNGGLFDPPGFDINTVNAGLRRLYL